MIWLRKVNAYLKNIILCDMRYILTILNKLNHSFYYSKIEQWTKFSSVYFLSWACSGLLRLFISKLSRITSLGHNLSLNLNQSHSHSLNLKLSSPQAKSTWMEFHSISLDHSHISAFLKLSQIKWSNLISA